jgi:replicative DNA helicase
MKCTRMAEVKRLGIPAHDIGAEQSVLGSLLISESAWSVGVLGKLTTDDFYRADHRIIFPAISTLHGKRLAVDYVTVCDYLERQGTIDDAGGPAYIARLAKDTPTADNIETYVAVVRERSLLRRFTNTAGKILRSAADVGERTAGELIAGAQQDLQDLQTSARTGKGLIDARQLIGELTDDLDSRATTAPAGLRLGLPDFDELTCGLESGDLVVIAARPGMGKTALLVSIASTISQSEGVAVFSAEMPAQQLMRRCLALQTEIPQGLLRRPEKLTNEDWSRIATAASTIAQRKLWIDDTGLPRLAHIRAETITLKARAPLGLVLVDYVQLVTAPGSNRYEQLRDVSYGLKALAKELAAPIIVLAQLNRSVESRDQKRPHLSDLRDSGAIEEAADVVGLLYSESYYDREFSMPYVLECSIEKNRNGERGQCLWHFDGAYSRVRPLDSGAASNYRRLLNKPPRSAPDL